MPRVTLAVAILALSLANGDLTIGDKNSKWRENNILISNINNYYKIIAVTTADANDRRKRFVSIISQAYMYYVTSDALTNLERVREAVTKVSKVLSQPADVIGAQTRAYFIILKTVIDQPINDVKAACPPTTEESDCLRELQKYHDRNRARCPEYDKNLHLYEKTISYLNDPEFADYVSDVMAISDNSDEVALAFFTYVVLVEYVEFFRKSNDVYRLRANITYPCSNSNLPLF